MLSAAVVVGISELRYVPVDMLMLRVVLLMYDDILYKTKRAKHIESNSSLAADFVLFFGKICCERERKI